MLKLMDEEERFLSESKSCNGCGHLMVLHSRAEGCCELPSCACQQGKMPCGECGFHEHRKECSKFAEEPKPFEYQRLSGEQLKCLEESLDRQRLGMRQHGLSTAVPGFPFGRFL